MIADVQVGTSGGNKVPQQASEQMEIWTTFSCRWEWTFKKFSKSQAKIPPAVRASTRCIAQTCQHWIFVALTDFPLKRLSVKYSEAFKKKRQHLTGYILDAALTFSLSLSPACQWTAMAFERKPWNVPAFRFVGLFEDASVNQRYETCCIVHIGFLRKMEGKDGS